MLNSWTEKKFRLFIFWSFLGIGLILLVSLVLVILHIVGVLTTTNQKSKLTQTVDANGVPVLIFSLEGETVGSISKDDRGNVVWNFPGILDPHTIRFEGMTTAERNELTASHHGDIIYNVDRKIHEAYTENKWQPLYSAPKNSIDQHVHVNADVKFNTLSVTGNISSINKNTITDTRWGYVGNMNQHVSENADVKFNTLSVTGNVNSINGTSITGSVPFLGNMDQGVTQTSDATFNAITLTSSVSLPTSTFTINWPTSGSTDGKYVLLGSHVIFSMDIITYNKTFPGLFQSDNELPVAIRPTVSHQKFIKAGILYVIEITNAGKIRLHYQDTISTLVDVPEGTNIATDPVHATYIL